MAVAHQVASAVETLATGAEGIGDELLRSQPRPPPVAARQPHAADQQLAGYPGGHRPAGAIHQVDRQIGNRSADRSCWALRQRRTVPGGHIDRRLGRPIEVVQLGRQPLGEPFGQLAGQRFAATDHSPHSPASFEVERVAAELVRAEFVRAELVQADLVEEGAQHRRHEVQSGHSTLGDQAGQIGALLMTAGLGDHQSGSHRQGPEKLPDRNIEGERSLLQDGVRIVQAVALLHPEDPVEDSAVRVHRPLRLAGGAGGVDHVGERLGVDVQI